MPPTPPAVSLSVIFLFTHGALARVWDRATEILAEQGIGLQVVSQMRVLDWNAFAGEVASADAVYLELTRHFSSFERLIEAAQAAAFALPAGIETQAAWPTAIDRDAQARLAAYLKAGTAENFVNAVRWLLHRAGKIATPPAPPDEPVLFGLYHPQAKGLWTDVPSYLAWADARACSATLGARPAPAVALIFDRNSWLDGETTAVDHCIDHLEKAALTPVPMFCDWDVAEAFGAPGHPLRRLLDQCQQYEQSQPHGGRLAAVWNTMIIHGREGNESGGPFAVHGVPVFQLIRNWTASAAEWRADDQGLSPVTQAFGLIRPEMLGCIDPTVTACSPRIDGATNERRLVEPLDDQVARLAERTRAWIALRQKSNADKRLALLLHNPPCKSLEATIGNAAALDALQSVVDLLRRLRDEGYTVGEPPSDGHALLERILQRKAISEFRWTSVEEIVAKGGVLAEIDEATFRADFDRQPETIREAVDAAWGAFPGKSMVHRPEGPDPTLVITGLAFGNVLVMTDPKRGCWGPRCDGEVCRILHDPSIAPSHHWLATFWWLQKNVDALIMMGTEGPLEFLPGKRAGLSESCYPSISLGQLPVIYAYLMSITGEGMIAKRRGRALLVDHLSAPVARADALGGRWDAIEDLQRQYLTTQARTSGARHVQLRQSLRDELAAIGLYDASADDQAGEAALDRAIDELPRRVAALRQRVLTLGLHTLGQAPDTEKTALYLAEARRGGIAPIEEVRLLDHLAACEEELAAIVRALAGGFVAPGPSGHLSRGKIEVLPTGRNFYSVDLSCLPTPAAEAVGRQMGEKLLLAYLADEGRLPETIGITLWSTDAFQADGELAAQILWLMGCAPARAANGKVSGVNIVPLSEMTLTLADGRVMARPRIDVVVQMSSVVRDLLPVIYALFDQAVAAVAELEETAEHNFVRAHIEARFAELRASLPDSDNAALKRLASYRCFSNADGGYGSGVGLALDASAWQDDADLSEVLINNAGTAFGADGRPATAPAMQQMAEYAHLIQRLDLSYQRASSVESDVLSSPCYLDVQGGTAAAKRGLSAPGGGDMRLYWGDSSTVPGGEVRSLAEELRLGLAASLLNPEWLAMVKTQGYTGASGISKRVNTLFAWSATARIVDKAQFDAVHDRLLADDANRDWLRTANVHAFEEIVRRLLEAQARGLWVADARRLAELHVAVLDIEGQLEDLMGENGVGAHQGGSVDVKTRGEVKEWKYAFTVKR